MKLIYYLLITVLVSGCASGSYSSPSDTDFTSAIESAAHLGRSQARNELEIVLSGSKVSGFLTKCTFVGLNKESVFGRASAQYYCETDHGDMGRKTFYENASLCDHEFKQIRQVPAFNIVYFLGSVNFGGDKNAAMRAYALLQNVCKG